MKTILVPIDLSPASARVCDAASAFAKLIKARLVLVSVVPPLPYYPTDSYGVDASALAQVLGANEKYTELKLREMGRRCAQRGISFKTVQETGPTVPTIMAKAKTVKASFIVIGSHGHGGMFEMIVGSTTHGVLRQAHCPVLVIPIREAKR